MKLAIPDCRAELDAFFLTLEQRRELLLLLAEKGEAGLEEFVRRHARGDSTLTRRLRRIKDRLMRDAEELRRRLKTDYDLKREAERARYESVVGRLRDEEERLEAERRRLAVEFPEALQRRIQELPLIQLAVAPPARLGWWRRLTNAIRRLIRALWHALVGIFRRKRSEARPKAIVIGAPGLAGPGIELEMDLEAALLASPDLRRRIRHRMGDTFAARARRLWRILLGVENYAEVAAEILRKEAEEGARLTAQEAEKKRRRIDEALARDRSSEEAEQRALEEVLGRLDRAEASDASHLQDTLDRRPVDELKRLVVEELEAAGLVQRLERGLRLTGRFLETFAALVYTEEARGVQPAATAAVGSSIEGEGLLERSRLLSHAEASHMDTVGTLVNARTNHPHIRHLFEEDVLVYREQRALRTHIIIVVDQSLSMSENDRIVAAKRAALALYYQTRRKGAQHRIDFILMETSVRRASLAEVWDAQPRGFTNVGRALRVAHELFLKERANRRLLFVVTDGLPEAMTVDGKDVAAKPEEALAYALRAADRLRRLSGLTCSLVLLEARDPLFVAAAEKIAKRVRGRVTKIEPQELAKSLLVQVRQDELLAS